MLHPSDSLWCRLGLFDFYVFSLLLASAISYQCVFLHFHESFNMSFASATTVFLHPSFPVSKSRVCSGTLARAGRRRRRPSHSRCHLKQLDCRSSSLRETPSSDDSTRKWWVPQPVHIFSACILMNRFHDANSYKGQGCDL